MPYTYRLTRIIPASPLDVYEAWLDSEVHSQMTGAEARMSDKIGADFSAWDDDVRGRNLELVPGERIVQAWRTSKFTGENEDSIVTITLERADDGTLLTLVHSNVPDEHRHNEEGGWESNYFAPMRAYFADLAEVDEAEVDELDEEEEDNEQEGNGDEDEEDDEDEEEDDEDDEDDEDEDEDEDDEDEDDEDDEDEDEDEEGELKEVLVEERVAIWPKEPEHAPPRPPAVKRTARRPAKKAARAKALPGKKTKRAAVMPRKAKRKTKAKLVGKAKKRTAAKRARPAAKKAKRAASKKKSAGRKRARR
jgi:uncharacterized protein YndB with AHSA1/START domain